MNEKLGKSILFTFALLVIAQLSGCIRQFGTGGTGELVVPRQQLREINPTDLSSAAVAPPSTQEATTLPTTRPATRPAVAVPLTLEEVRRWALMNNLDLKVAVLDPTIARETLSAEEARFESIFFANVNYSKTDAPTSSKLSSSQAESVGLEAGVRVPLQTGGVLQFSLPMNRFETNNEFSTLNPAYTADYVASISQPLLRGGGFGVNAQPIRVAFYAYQQSEARTKLAVIGVLADIDRVYWQLYAARGALEVRKAEYDLAAAQLERARRQVRAGTMGEPEVVRAEAGVADSLEAIITAENLVRLRQRDMKRMLRQPGMELDSTTIIVPATLPGALFYKLDSEQLVRVALAQRMEMLDLELQLAQQAANIGVARNDLLPLVNLNYTYSISGLGSSLNNALGMAGNHDFDNHQVGVSVEVPIGNEAAKARLRGALASRLQVLASREQRAAAIAQEVLNALDRLEANWQRIIAARKRVIYSQRVLDVENRQFGQGLRTSTDVLDAQTRLANAQLSEVSAIADYQISQVDIAFATGTVLGASKVIWEPAKIKK
ncbi:MAG TPA: TolC family protein [Tepidisphaeraceae bacterium]|jgi:outer membrane protein TolC|nr:TolC family protein [Tepidisphaeraceae bacterium]